MRSLLALAVLTAGVSEACGAGPQPAPAVGFRSFWTLDPARSYRTAFDGGRTYGAEKSPRPVLVNLWYPAQAGGGPVMMHGDYLDFVPADFKLKPLAAALLDYERATLTRELTGTEASKTTAAQRQAVDRVLKRPTGCVRDAKAAPGRHPLVIYHAGAGSSFEDNALLCEELARAGYAVLGGPFQAADGASLNIDALNAGREIEFLLRVAAGLSHVDAARVGLVGHSAGAQGALIYAARGGVALDALVSLDTTQEYSAPADPRWPELRAALTDGRERYAVPTLFVARPPALFVLADGLTKCERTYLTLPELTHNEFISQGEDAATLAAELTPDEKNVKRAAAVAAGGQTLRRLVTQYLDAKLKGDQKADAALMELRTTKLGAGPRIERAAAGTAGPPDDLAEASPRAVLRALQEGGAEAAIRVLKRADALSPFARDPYFAMQLLYALGAGDNEADARKLNSHFLSLGVDARPMIVGLADLFASLKRSPEFVAGCVKLGRVIGDGDPAVAHMVRQHGAK